MDCVINRIVLWVAWALCSFLSAFIGHLIVLVMFRLASRAEASGGRSEFPFALPIHQHATHAQVFLETWRPFVMRPLPQGFLWGASLCERL